MAAAKTFCNSLGLPIPDESFGLGLNCIWGELHCLHFVQNVKMCVSGLHCFKSSTQIPVKCVCPSSQ